MEKVNANDLEYRQGDWGPKYLHRGPHLEWGLIRLRPGDSLGAHGHKEVQEIFYFVDGGAVMVVNGEEHRARGGDAFRLEEGESHDIVNDTGEAVNIVFIKCPYRPEDKYGV